MTTKPFLDHLRPQLDEDPIAPEQPPARDLPPPAPAADEVKASLHIAGTIRDPETGELKSTLGSLSGS